MYKKMLKLIALVMMVSLVLAACAQATPAATQAPVATEAPTVVAPAATEVPTVTEPVTIMIWHMEQPAYRVARIQELIDAFNAANPGIVVKQEPQSWGDIYTKAPAAVAAGNGPDILFAIPDFTPIMRATNAVQPVEDFVAQMNTAHKFMPFAVAPYTYDGHTWAVPMWNMSHNLWYSKSAFEKAGVTPPTTWTEWLAAAEKLTTSGQYGIGLPGNKNLYTDQVAYDFMANNGAGEIYNSDGTLRFDNPQTVEALDFYSKLFKFSPPDSTGWAWGEAEACLASKTCAMVLQYTVISTFDSQSGSDASDLGVVAIPHNDGQTQSNTIAYSNAAMVLTADKAKQDAAYKFLSFLLEPKNYGSFLTMEPGLYLPVTEDGSVSETFWNDPMVVKYKSQIETMVENSKNGMLFGFTNGNTFQTISQISAQNLIAQTLQKILVDKEPAAQAVTEGQKLMEESIAK